MSIAKVIEVTSQSHNSFDEAARNAYEEASKSVKNIKHVYVKDFKMEVKDDGTFIYRTTCKVTFIIGNSGME